MGRETGGFRSRSVDALDDDINLLEFHDPRRRQAIDASPDDTEPAIAATWVRLSSLAYAIEGLPRAIADGLGDLAPSSITDSEVAG